MVNVNQYLVVGVGVDGCYQIFFDVDVVLQYFGDWGQVVGCVGCIGNDGYFLGQQVVIDVIDDGCIDIVVVWCGNQYVFGVLVEQCFGFGFGGVGVGIFEQYVDVVVGLVDVFWIFG